MLYLSSLKNTGIPAFGSSVKLRCLAKNEGAQEGSQILPLQSKEGLCFQFRKNNHHSSSFFLLTERTRTIRIYENCNPPVLSPDPLGAAKLISFIRPIPLPLCLETLKGNPISVVSTFGPQDGNPQQLIMGCNFASESNALNGIRIGC